MNELIDATCAAVGRCAFDGQTDKSKRMDCLGYQKSCTPHTKNTTHTQITNNPAITMAAAAALTTIFRHLLGNKILHTHKRSPIL
jgi:3D (Asp-Asp-Asp) domain-containing protein